MSFVSKEEALSYLGLATPDARLLMQIDEACALVEEFTGTKFESTNQIDFFDGGDAAIVLNKSPIIAVTEVYDITTSTALTTDQFHCADSGVARRCDCSYWPDGMGRWRITYSYGYAETPAPVRSAALKTLERIRSGQDGRQKMGERIGDYSVSYTAFATKGAPSALSDDVATTLRRYQRKTNA